MIIKAFSGLTNKTVITWMRIFELREFEDCFSCVAFSG